MKKLLAIALIVAVGVVGFVGYSKTKVANAQVKTACDPTKIKVIMDNTLNSTVIENQEDVPVLKFVVKNENLASACNFSLRNIYLEELLQYNGSVVEELQLKQGTTNIADFEVQKFLSEIKYRLPNTGVNVSIAANTQKEFTVMSPGFENKPEDHGVYFALGVQFVKGFVGNNVQVNNWQVPAKWGQIFFVTQQ